MDFLKPSTRHVLAVPRKPSPPVRLQIPSCGRYVNKMAALAVRSTPPIYNTQLTAAVFLFED